MKLMPYKLFLFLMIVISVSSCKPVEHVITHHKYITHTVDSIRWHDSTVVVPHEVYTNIAWNYDTLTLETSLAKAECWVDSIWLRGNISNKQQVIYKYIEVEKWRDSIVYEKVPEPYTVIEQVPNQVNKKLRWWAIISTIGLGCSLVYIFRKPLLKLILSVT